jgi:hypothetical protein
MDFFAFHLMPWPHLPDDYEEKYDSAIQSCRDVCTGSNPDADPLGR